MLGTHVKYVVLDVVTLSKKHLSKKHLIASAPWKIFWSCGSHRGDDNLSNFVKFCQIIQINQSLGVCVQPCPWSRWMLKMKMYLGRSTTKTLPTGSPQLWINDFFLKVSNDILQISSIFFNQIIQMKAL